MSYTYIYLQLQNLIKTRLLRDILKFKPSNHPEVSENDLKEIIAIQGDSQNTIGGEILDSFITEDKDKFIEKFNKCKEILSTFQGKCEYDGHEQLWKAMNTCIMTELREDWNECWNEF